MDYRFAEQYVKSDLLFDIFYSGGLVTAPVNPVQLTAGAPCNDTFLFIFFIIIKDYIDFLYILFLSSVVVLCSTQNEVSGTVRHRNYKFFGLIFFYPPCFLSLQNTTNTDICSTSSSCGCPNKYSTWVSSSKRSSNQKRKFW